MLYERHSYKSKKSSQKVDHIFKLHIGRGLVFKIHEEKIKQLRNQHILNRLKNKHMKDAFQGAAN